MKNDNSTFVSEHGPPVWGSYNVADFCSIDYHSFKGTVSTQLLLFTQNYIGRWIYWKDVKAFFDAMVNPVSSEDFIH